MYYTYVLRSQKDRIHYTGSGADPYTRLLRHNNGGYRFTKGHRPWKLVYTEGFSSRTEARRREKFLKSGQGRKFLDNVLGAG